MNQTKCNMISQSMSCLDFQVDDGKWIYTTPKIMEGWSESRRRKPRHTNAQSWRRSWASPSDESSDNLENSLAAKKKRRLEFEENAENIEVSPKVSKVEEVAEEFDPCYKEFLSNYTSICDWLNTVQAKRSRSFSKSEIEFLGTQLLKRKHWRVRINEEAKHLAIRNPPLTEECEWRMRHLNSQWESLEKILLSNQQLPLRPKNGVGSKIDGSGIKWLKSFLEEIEGELQPLSFSSNWSKCEVQHQIERHKALQLSIDTNTAKVHEAFRLFSDKDSGRKSRLEKRWWQLRLRVLEWNQHLEILEKNCPKEEKKEVSASRQNSRTSQRTPSSSDEESFGPRLKYRRLGDTEILHFPTACQSSDLFLHQFSLSVMGNNKEYEALEDGIVVSRKGIPNSSSTSYLEVIFDGESASGGNKQMLMSSSNSSLSSVSYSSKSSSLKRKLSSSERFFDKFEHFETLEESLGNISTYYFQHNSEKDDRNKGNCKGKGKSEIIIGEREEADGCEDSELDDSQKCAGKISLQDEFAISPEGIPLKEEEEVEFFPLRRMEKSKIIDSEIGELVQKAEELARRKAKSQDLLRVISDIALVNESSDEDALDQSNTNGNRQKGKLDGLKKQFSKMEEVISALESSGGSGPGNGKYRRVRKWLNKGKENAKGRRVKKRERTISGTSVSSYCEASGESASSEQGDAYNSDPDVSNLSSSEEREGLSLLQQTQQVLSALRRQNQQHDSLTSSSSGNQNKSPTSSGVQLRAKPTRQRNKQRPKSFTTDISAGVVPESFNFVVSDTALNLRGTPSAHLPLQKSALGGSSAGRRKKVSRGKRRLSNELNTSSATIQWEGEGRRIRGSGHNVRRSTSFCEYLPSQEPLPDSPEEEEGEQEVPLSLPKPNFKILGPVSTLLSGSHSVTPEVGGSSSMNTNPGEQDWDSYQERYLSSELSYSEDPYDPNDTLKLLSFGEDYGQYIDALDSEGSSELPARSIHKRTLKSRRVKKDNKAANEIDELNFFLSQTASQLKLMEYHFLRDSSPTAATFAQIEVTCNDNVQALKGLLEKGIDNLQLLSLIENLLEKWGEMQRRVRRSSELSSLRSDFTSVHSDLEGTLGSFEFQTLSSLQERIGQIEDTLKCLTQRKVNLQELNESPSSSSSLRDQIQELYALYEENYELGNYLLDKMRFLQEAWKAFEEEKTAFEEMTLRGRDLGSPLSSDSGHGTEDSHDSGLSGDEGYSAKREKLDELRKRAGEIKALLPKGCTVVGVIEKGLQEAELNLLNPRNPRLSSILNTKRRKGAFTSSNKRRGHALLAPPRKWRIIRKMIAFNFTLMGLFLTAAYMLTPNCCENLNTFCFSLIPQLSHDGVPPI